LEKDILSSLLAAADIPLFGFVPYHNELLLTQKNSHRVPENCRTVIVCLFPYFTGKDETRNVSYYAVGKDYHLILSQYLGNAVAAMKERFSCNQFVSFADSSPIREIQAAAEAGLGVIGKNRLFLTEKYGSYVFIGEILTDLTVEATRHEIKGCTDCGACVASCPSHTLSSPEAPCLSAVTQQKRSWSDEEKRLYEKGALVWGCDRCQEVCPMNKNAERTPLAAFYEARRPVVTEENVTEDFDERAYAWRGKDVILRNLRAKKE